MKNLISCLIALGLFGLSSALPGSTVGDKETGHTGAVSRLVYAFGGELLVSANEFGVLHFWSAEGKLLRTVEPQWAGAPTSLGADGEGNLLIAGNKAAREKSAVWKVSKEGTVSKLFDIAIEDAKTLAFSRDTTLLAAGTWKGKSFVIDVKSGKVARSLGEHPNSVDVIAISPNNQILSATSGQAIKVWNIASGKQHADIPKLDKLINALFFTPDSQKLLVDHGDEVEVWTATMGKRVGVKKKGMATGAFDPNGNITLIRSGNELHLWNIQKNRVVETVFTTRSRNAERRPDFSEIAAVAISPNGKQIAIGMLSGRIILREVKQGRQ